MAKITRRKSLTPKAQIDQAMEVLKDVDADYRVFASDIPRDTYALLVFGLAGACKIERASETKFTINSTKSPGKRFAVTDQSTFRRSFSQMVKVLEPSPDKRKDFMTSLENYAEVCLSVAEAHAASVGFLPLDADNLAPSTTTVNDDSSLTDVDPYFAQQPERSMDETEPIKVVTTAGGVTEYFCTSCDESATDEGAIRQHLDHHLPGRQDTRKMAQEGDLKSAVVEPPSSLEPYPLTMSSEQQVVKVEPFQAKHYQTKDHGVKRDSELINVVTYADGTVAFQCRVCSEYTSENPRSLNGHMGKHSREEREEAKAKPALHRTEKWVPTQNQKNRITRLANEIAKAMELGLTSPESIASAIIEARAIDPTNRDGSDGSEIPEMTPEQQIEAIRRILGADQAVKEARDEQEKMIAGLQDQIDSMRAEMESLRHQEASAQRELNDLKTWYYSMPLKG